MKQVCKAAIALAALSVSAAANAEEMSFDSEGGLYLRLDTGWSFSRDIGGDVNDDAGNSFILGGGIGYRFNDYLRADVTLGWRGGYDVSTTETFGPVTETWEADVSALTGMVNLYADVARLGMFTPYVGGGIGFSRNRVTDAEVSALGLTASIDDGAKTSFAWQVSAGVGVEVASNWTIDIGYRYLDLGSVETGDTATLLGVSVPVDRAEGDLRAHELQVGVRYSF